MSNYGDYEDNFAICVNMWKSITDKHGDNALATEFTPEERAVVLIVFVEGIVYRDGFEGLFQSKLAGDPDYKFTLEAFERIGCAEAVETLKEALRLFPEGSPPRDDKVRMEQYMNHPEGIRNSIDSRFWGSHESIYKCLANYIRERTRLFASYGQILIS